MYTTISVNVLHLLIFNEHKQVHTDIRFLKHLEIMNDPLSERYYSIIKEKVKEDYYWEQKVKNFIKTGSYYDK